MVSSFRLIQPAVQQPLPATAIGESVHTKASSVQLGKRIHSVAQACRSCRQNKVKCDGRRPQCGTCSSRLRSCRYESKVNMPRRAALKTRLEALEKLFSTLQAKPTKDANLLLQQIRSSDDIDALLDLEDETSPPGPNGSITSSGVSSFSSPTAGTASEEQSVRSSPSVGPSIISSSLQEVDVNDETSQKASLSTPASAQRELSIDVSRSLVSLVIPSAATTQAAVDSFFNSSGRLFHVFSREQVMRCHKDVFMNEGCAVAKQKTAICCLAAVAAVGVQYNGDDFDVGADAVFYDVARHFFENLVEEQPLDAIKACTMLAMYNILIKATVSLAYIDIGLSMSKRHSLNDKLYHHPSLSPEEWADYRRAWRSLIWLSSTLGYIKGGDISFRELVPLVEVEIDHASEVGHIVQIEMTKISLLNADILRMHLSSEEMALQAIDAIDKDLQDWHDLLPSEMHLPNLCRQDLPVEARRSILATHLLYLGTRMLLYRRIASQFVWSPPTREKNAARESYEATLLSHADQAITAAKQSSRILGLLQAEKGIFKKCWLIIFQSYTCCVVLLHCVAQKQIHHFPRSSWEDDLTQARTCLDVLSFCSTVDSVALKFRDCVVPIHDKLTSYIFPLPSVNTPHNPSSLGYMLKVPTTTDPDRVSLSLKLLTILCQPFSNINSKCGPDESPSKPGESKNLQPGKEMNWKVDSCPSFQWDAQSLGIGASVFLEGDNRFMGSDQPSGWTGVDGEDELEELDLVS
ncbi:Zn(2)-C6 fungal-type domain-containing protein [Fusarium sp. LHS14.1]|nr:Zn(2)-C6 fungal-type domain-containing protein [Fusarium sp. LHS14.1]